MANPEFSEVVRSLDEMPRTVEELVNKADRDSIGKRPSEKGWSVLEHICHLRDIEVEGYPVRITKIINEEAPFLPDIDGDRLAEERDYIHQDFNKALGDFITARKNNVLAIKGLSVEQRGRIGAFENVGTVTLDELLIKMYAHDQEHLREIESLISAQTPV